MLANTRAYVAMLEIAVSTGHIQAYSNDLLKSDRIALSVFRDDDDLEPFRVHCKETYFLEDGEPFVWIIRSTGTELARICSHHAYWKSVSDRIILARHQKDDNRTFVWDGNKFEEWTYKDAKEFNQRILDIRLSEYKKRYSEGCVLQMKPMFANDGHWVDYLELKDEEDFIKAKKTVKGIDEHDRFIFRIIDKDGFVKIEKS